MTQKYTIIITTNNRPMLFKRVLSYYNQCNEKNRIIVADTSTDEIQQKNKETISSYSNLDVFYLTKFPKLNEFPGPSGQFLKIAESMRYVKDKYCLTCADDDFIIPNGIKKSIEFLEKNQDFVVAHGQYMGFDVSKDSTGKPVFRWKYDNKTDSNTHSDPKARLMQQMSNYALTIYAVHRTETMKLVWEETIRTKNLGVFGELTASMLTSVYGKIKGLDVLYNFRQDRRPDSMSFQAKKLYDYVTDGTYYDRYSRLKKCIAPHLSKKTNMSLKEAEKIVDKGWAEHTKRYKGFVSSKISHMMKNMPMSPKFDEEMKKVYRKFRKRKPFQLNMEEVEKEPSAEHLEEYKIIKKIILENLEEEICEQITI